MTNLFFIGLFRHGAGSVLSCTYRLHQIFVLYTNIFWDQKNKLYSGRVSCYVEIKYEEEL